MKVLWFLLALVTGFLAFTGVIIIFNSISGISEPKYLNGLVWIFVFGVPFWFFQRQYLRSKRPNKSLRSKRDLLSEQTEVMGRAIMDSARALQDGLEITDSHTRKEVTFQLLLLSGFWVRKTLGLKMSEVEARHIANELAYNAVIIIGGGKNASEADKRHISEGIDHLMAKFGSLPLKKADGSTAGTFLWEYSKDLVEVATGHPPQTQIIQMQLAANVTTDAIRQLNATEFCERLTASSVH